MTEEAIKPFPKILDVPRPRVLRKEEWPPNYQKIYIWRQETRKAYAENEKYLAIAKIYYKDHPAQFICDWVNTFDPRNAFIGMPVRLPLVLFQRQAELVEFLYECLRTESNGLIDKSRDMGATWICAAFSVWLWMFWPGASIGWGSRKEVLVDKLGDPDSIFEKMRMIIRGLPKELWPDDFSMDSHTAYMRILNSQNNSTITGEAGDNIGRGGRKLIYFKDESAHYERPESIEASLGDNTRVQIDISTPNGVGTVYDRKKLAGQVWTSGCDIPKGVTRVFIMDWSDHPAKTEQWHAEREAKARSEGLLHIFRQEVDRDASASLQGIIIPAEWVRAALDAHVHLKFGDDGMWSGALDVADEGGDLNALTFRKGVVLRYYENWGEGDTGIATRRVVAEASTRQPVSIQYDCIGVGAGVKAESNRLVADHTMPRGISLIPWNAGGAVLNPEQRVIPGDTMSPLNKDYYANVKAQAWWALRRRFEKTYRMRVEGIVYPVDQLISISSAIPKHQELMRELSQPVMTHDGKLRLLVDKKPDGARSPNGADSVVMNYFPLKVQMVLDPGMLQRAKMEVRR